MYEYRARLLKVVDADTLDLEAELGFGVARADRFRLFGLNAPEMSTPEGRAAKAWVLSALACTTAVADWPLVVNTYKDGREKFGRYLARVRVAETGWDLNAELVKAGHAVEKHY